MQHLCVYGAIGRMAARNSSETAPGNRLGRRDPPSLYKRYKPEEARHLAKRLEIHHTPVHGSWLNIAEIELNAMTRQCLARRIENLDDLNRELRAWEQERNAETRTVNWHFKSGDAREKLKSLYPKLS